MEEYIITSISTIIFLITTVILGYKGYYDKYKGLAFTIYKALMDGRITEEEIEDIKKAYLDTKK